VKIKIIIHEAEEGGYWAEVPAIPGCATEGETFEELLQNLYEALEGCQACRYRDLNKIQAQTEHRTCYVCCKYVTIILEPTDKSIRYGCSKS
jgi:predicted RNase H-like HicB family nuclease